MVLRHKLLRALGAAGLLLGAGTIIAPAASADGHRTITVNVDCVSVDHNGDMTALFGYDNTTSQTITVKVGDSNKVSPSSLDGEQVYTFSPGSHPGAWQTQASQASSISWDVSGYSATADDTSPNCGKPIALSAAGNNLAGPIVLIGSVPVALAVGLIARRRRRSAATN